MYCWFLFFERRNAVTLIFVFLRSFLVYFRTEKKEVLFDIFSVHEYLLTFYQQFMYIVPYGQEIFIF